MAIGSGVFAFLGSVQSNYLIREEHLVIQIWLGSRQGLLKGKMPPLRMTFVAHKRLCLSSQL